LIFIYLQGLLLVPNGEALGNWFGDGSTESEDSFTEINNWKNITHINKTSTKSSHSWGILFTILGTVLLDFDADACQSPARAYLLDVCLPEDHAKGLSTFTVMAGLGGFFGYSMGGLNWDETEIGKMNTVDILLCFTKKTYFRTSIRWTREGRFFYNNNYFCYMCGIYNNKFC